MSLRRDLDGKARQGLTFLERGLLTWTFKQASGYLGRFDPLLGKRQLDCPGVCVNYEVPLGVISALVLETALAF